MPTTTALLPFGVATGPDSGAVWRENACPPSCENQIDASTGPPPYVCSSQEATRSTALDADSQAGPFAPAHGGVQATQSPADVSCAPPTTVRSTCSSQPRPP